MLASDERYTVVVVVVTLGPLQNALLLRSDPLRLFVQLAQGGERISTIELPAGPAYLVHEPELVAQLLLDRAGTIKKHLLPGVFQAFGTGLFTSSGATHSVVRHAAQHAFHRLQIEAWTDEVRAMTEQSLGALTEGELDVKSFFERMTFLIVGRLLFGMDLSDVAQEFFDCAEELQELFLRVEASPAAEERFETASRRIDQLFKQTLEQQPAAREEGVLSRALAATGQVSEEQLIEEFRSFLMATIPTSLLLATACWLLAKNPEEQARLHDTDPNPGLENVVHETLRLYPPGWLLIREAVESFELDGISYPAKTAFLVCVWTLHRNPRLFPGPNNFQPQRWSDKRDLPRGAYLPFSLGARSCVGERLSRLITQHTLRPLTDRFRLLQADRPDPEWLPRITFAPRAGIWVRLQRKRA